MQHLNDYLQQSIVLNWNNPAMTDFKGETFSYKDVARKIEKLHILMETSGVKPGDKVSICGRNSSQWAIAFIATMTYGAVGVSILQDFKPDNIHHIVNHSDSKFFFVADSIWENLDIENLPNVETVLMIDDYSLLYTRINAVRQARARLNELFGKKFPNRFTPEDVNYYTSDINDLALLNYTSGSTGFSKGVMLSYRNLASNVRFCVENLPFLLSGDKTVSMLPMAHMYGLAIELLHPFAKGCHIHFLTRNPSPQVIMQAFAEVKPKLIVAVPLILEKIIKTKVFPLLDKPIMKLLMMIPIVDNQLFGKIKAKLNETFGGQMVEMILGGAALNKEVEAFLKKIDFPYTVGYGMTECAPLISYAPHEVAKTTSCGKVVTRMDARIDSEDPANIVGEILVKGDNVMLGYYKNEEATEAMMTPDGWLRTGDLGVIDSDGFIFIKGRSKNMILGPSGQNIYPEEIEDLLNNMPYVMESLIVEQESRLVALIYPDFENAEKMGITRDNILSAMEENRIALNKEIPSYSQISKVKIHYEEFEKTPKRSIKRYLYQN